MAAESELTRNSPVFLVAKQYDNLSTGHRDFVRWGPFVESDFLGAVRSAGNVPIVFSSTCAVYGEPASVPITEEVALAPVNPYGRTMLAFEHTLADYEAAYGLRSVRRGTSTPAAATLTAKSARATNQKRISSRGQSSPPGTTWTTSPSSAERPRCE